MVSSKQNNRTVRVQRGGQITIPIEFRRAFGLEEGSLLEITLTENRQLTMRPVATGATADNTWMRKLYEVFEPVRREIRESGMSEEDLDALIDESVEEARTRRYLKYQGHDSSSSKQAL